MAQALAKGFIAAGENQSGTVLLRLSPPFYTTFPPIPIYIFLIPLSISFFFLKESPNRQTSSEVHPAPIRCLAKTLL